MITHIYLVRHAQSDPSVKDNKTRPLTQKGLTDAEQLSEYFGSIPVDLIFSSPYLRAVQTVTPVAKSKNLPVQTDERVREWMGGRPFPSEMFWDRMKEMFSDEASTNGGAESIKALKRRTGEFLSHLLCRHPGKTIIVGTHALALTCACKVYNDDLGLSFLRSLIPVAPFSAHLIFDGYELKSMEFIDPIQHLSDLHAPRVI